MKIILGLLFFCIEVSAAAQVCGPIDANYFLYPKNTNDSAYTVRKKDFLIQTDLKTKDTTAWKVKWKGDCVYSLEYVSGNKKLQPDVKNFIEAHQFVYKIVEHTNDYFVFEGYVDKISGSPFSIDTGFFKRKEAPVDNRLFAQVNSLIDLKKQRFSDTSKYAVVYIYRQGKFNCSGVDGLVYANDEVMASLKTKSAFIFKILRQGNLKIGSSFNNKVSSKNIIIEYGKRYYIQFDPVWGQGCKPEIIISEDLMAKQDFEALL